MQTNHAEKGPGPKRLSRLVQRTHILYQLPLSRRQALNRASAFPMNSRWFLRPRRVQGLHAL